MFSDKIKYNPPLPGAEFRSRDLTIPSEACKVLYEIDFQYGQDRELCLSILTSVFRGYPQVTQVLQETGKKVQGDGPTSAPWHYEAIVARTVRLAILEQEVSSLSGVIKSLGKELLTSKGIERQSTLEMEREERGMGKKGTPSGSQFG